jgi:signal transduction histidine kinase
MLQFGRNAGTELRATAIEPVVKEIVSLLERRTRARDIALDLAIEPALPDAWLDGNELEQVMVNLVNNAIDAIAGAGRITITAVRDADHILLTVRDDGCGIAERDLDNVFQPFFTTKPPGQGTGLGLSVVYGIVRGWGGTIHVESVSGQGTTMAIRIPLADARRQQDPGASRGPVSAQLVASQGRENDHDRDAPRNPAAAGR